MFKQTWWNDRLADQGTFEEYLGWIGSREADSRQFVVDFVKNRSIRSTADFGCGPCIDYQNLIAARPDMRYLGIDSCSHVRPYAEKSGANFLHSEIAGTGLQADDFDLSYARHVLEHQSSFEPVLSEMIRVAREYVIHIFFIKPNEKLISDYDQESNLYHNTYRKEDVDLFLDNHIKVRSHEWNDITSKEEALVVRLHTS